MRHPDIINTGRLGPDEWRSTMPAEACTEIGADQGDDDRGRPGEGGAIALLFAVAAVTGCAIVAQELARIFQ